MEESLGDVDELIEDSEEQISDFFRTFFHKNGVSEYIEGTDRTEDTEYAEDTGDTEYCQPI